MSQVVSSLAYIVLFVSTFGCILLLLLKWNSEEKVPLDEQREGV